MYYTILYIKCQVNFLDKDLVATEDTEDTEIRSKEVDHEGTKKEYGKR